MSEDTSQCGRRLRVRVPTTRYSDTDFQRGSQGRRARLPLGNNDNNDINNNDEGQDDDGYSEEEDVDDEDATLAELVAPANRAEPVMEGEGVDGEEDGEEQPDDDEGYDTEIEERSHPRIPLPDLTAARVPDSDGWALIARLGPTSAFLSSFTSLQEVPDQHHQAWVEGVAEVLRRWSVATSEVEINHALFWFLFLPQGLLRRPSRGGRVGRKEVAKRFSCLTRGDWGSLVELWERDKVRLGEDRARRDRRGQREVSEEEALRRKRKEVLALISAGQISRAMQRVTSHGLAKMSDPAVQAQVAAKYPPRRRPLPDRVPRGQAVEHMRQLRDNLKALQAGSSPGCGGMRPEYLRVVGEVMEEADMNILEEFGMAYLRGDLPKWFTAIWLTVQTVPIFKTSGKCTVRPLGLRTPLLKLYHKQVVSQSITEVKAHLEPQQLGMSVAGAQKLAHFSTGLSTQKLRPLKKLNKFFHL